MGAVQLKVEEAISEEALLARAREFVQPLRQRREEIDKIARPPEDLSQQMKDAGIFALTRPLEYGGLQTSLDTWRKVVTEIGRGDCGVAWGLTLVTACNWMAANMYPKHVSAEIFAEPGNCAAGVFSGRAAKARRVDGGIHVDKGMWFFNSGVYQANWNLLGVPMFDKAGNPVGPGVAAVPMSDVINLNDWDPSGLRGSGSTNVAMEDVFIPDERIVSLMGCNRAEVPIAYPDSTLYNSAFGPLMVAILSFPLLGLAKHMVEHYLEFVGKRDIKLTTYTNQAEAPVTHIQLGEVSAMFDAAESVIKNSITNIDYYAQRREVMPLEERSKVTRDTAYADKLIWDGANILANASGGSFSSNKNLMNRLWQDAKVGTLHPFVNTASNFESHGRILCGMDELLMQV